MSKSISGPLVWPVGSPFAQATPKTESQRSLIGLAAGFASAAGQSDDLQTLQQELCNIAADGLEADFAKLLVHGSDGQGFLVVAGVGWRSGVVGCSRQDTDKDTATGFAWHTGTSIVSDILGDKRFRIPDLVLEHGLARTVDVPVSGDGVLGVGWLSPGHLSNDDLLFLQLLAHSLAAATNRLEGQARCKREIAISVDEHHLSLREMQHRVRNDLQVICSSIDHESRNLNDAEHRTGYDRVSRLVMALGGLYDHLLVDQPGGTLEMGGYLESLCSRISAAGDLPSRGIVLQAHTQHLEMPTERAGRLGIAINQLVTNAAEHAFPDDQGGRILVRLFTQVADGTGDPVVTVSDDGCGFKGPRPGSFGLGLVDALVRRAGGVLTRLDGEGTEWRINLKS